MAISIQEEIGKRYGRLTVISFTGKRRVGSNNTTRSFFLCVCDCGEKRTISINGLRSGNTRSCGCFKREINSTTHLTHGGSYSPEYRTWFSMKRRCYEVGKADYRYYGGRGIGVCARWRNSFENFLADMGPRPSADHSIDRIDNSIDYGPSNCRWATRKEQNRNKRSNRYIELNGRTMALCDWALEYGIGVNTLASRLRLGWPMDRALSTPVRPIRQCTR